jgi:ribosomal protein S12 methylthiotransferase
MEYSLSQEVKQEPANHFMDVQEQISYDLNQEKIGKTFKVLIDKEEGGHFVGRTDFDFVEVDNEVLIDAAKHYCRVGTLCPLVSQMLRSLICMERSWNSL